jgi:hypothetical protein
MQPEVQQEWEQYPKRIVLLMGLLRCELQAPRRRATVEIACRIPEAYFKQANANKAWKPRSLANFSSKWFKTPCMQPKENLEVAKAWHRI